MQSRLVADLTSRCNGRESKNPRQTKHDVALLEMCPPTMHIMQ
jgi:hypothetical protein